MMSADVSEGQEGGVRIEEADSIVKAEEGVREDAREGASQ